MASAWRAFVKLLGFGKEDEKIVANKPVRFHPYDEVSDDQLEEKRSRLPRYHPYDEVSDDQLEEKRSHLPRYHPYDEVSGEQLEENRASADPPRPPLEGKKGGHSASKMVIASAEENTAGAKGASGGSGLHYVEVDFQPETGAGGRGGTRGSGTKPPPRASEESTIYSEVRPGAT